MIPQSEYYSDVTHDFCAVYKKRSGMFNMKSFHYHNVHELYYFITGERKLFYKDRIYHITPGDIVIIKKYEIHSIGDWEAPGHSMIMIDFKDDFLMDFPSDGYNLLECFDKDVIVLSANSEHKERAYEKFNDILLEYNGNMPGKTPLIKAHLTELLIYLSRLQNIYGDKKESLSRKQAVIEQTMKYINDNYENKLSLQEIADYMGYSKNYLCSYFKKNSGFSLVEYLNGVRVKKSQDYLKNTSLSITNISTLCGFESITHFGRVFKSIAGCSPLQYRKATHI
ncbi:MAG: helix-turn-helix domain-containing protein [Clostridia bacterium]